MDAFYKKTDPTKTITIVEDKDSFYQLSDGQMIKKDIFPKYYTKQENVSINESVKVNSTSNDFIDADSFLNTTSSLDPNIIEKIQQADPSKGTGDGQERTTVVSNTTNKTKVNVPIQNNTIVQQNEPLIRQVDPASQPIPNNTNIDVSQYKVYDDDDDAYKDFVDNKTEISQPPVENKVSINPEIAEIEHFFEDEKVAFGLEEAEKRKQVRLKKIKQPAPTTNNNNNNNNNIPVVNVQPSQPIAQPTFDPAEMMFKSFKRNHDITINIKINDKIGNPDFIKMMMENMDGDIIGFYKNLIMEKVMSDLHIIEDAIENSIKETIFDENEKVEVENKKAETTKTEVVKVEPVKVKNEKIKNIKIENEGVNLKDLVKGGMTKTGKQKYKFINDLGNVVEMISTTAKKKGYKPYKK